MRGNVDTRLRKRVERGLDGVVLAACGLERLGLEREIGFRLPVDRFVPEVGQGVVVLQTRRGEEDVAAALDDAERPRRAAAERAAVARLGGGCTTPVAAHAAPRGRRLDLRAWVGRARRRRVAGRDGERADPGPPRRRSPTGCCARRGGAAGGGARVTVYLVGAGPGDPGLITARGLELVRRAEVLVYDRLAGARLVAEAPPGCLLLDAGKAPGPADDDAGGDERRARRARAAPAGTVVRLKGGDPFVFGRGAEEAEALRAAGVPFEVVPGVTSAIAVPAYAGIPVTHRGLATRFTVVTGHEDPTKGASDVDWAALARVGGTLVFLMGVGRLGRDRRRAGGRRPRPADAGRGRARRHARHPGDGHRHAGDDRGRRRGACARRRSSVVGDVVALRDAIAWAEQRPLHGVTVVVTRARAQARGLAARLREPRGVGARGAADPHRAAGRAADRAGAPTTSCA